MLNEIQRYTHRVITINDKEVVLTVISETDKNRVDTIRCNVESAEEYFSSNKKRFTSDKTFVFKSTLTTEDRKRLSDASRPEIEMNVTEAYISRFLGDFVKQVPDLFVSAENNQIPSEKIDIIEGFIRHTFTSSDYRVIASKVMKDAMCGFGVMEICTDYKNEMSFEHDIKLKYIDPMLCGFDPMAKTPSKGDGEFCYKLVPKAKKELKEEYPDLDLNEVNKIPLNIPGDFSWHKNHASKEVYYIADYYEKTYKTVMLFQISNPDNPSQTVAMTEDDYNKRFNADDDLVVKPEIVKQAKRRICSIKRYKIVGNQLLSKPEKIDSKFLPLVFFDGNSVELDNQQYTRSYFYNVKDAQRVKNISASSFMYDQLTMRQTDIIIPKEAMPTADEERNAWRDPQRVKGALVYNHFAQDGMTPLPAPQVVPRGSINAQSMQIYNMQDKTIQSILGSYDSQMGIQGNQLSGVAIENSSVNSSEAAAPFIISFMSSLQHIGKIITHLIPVYFTNQRTIPVLRKNGEKDKQMINDVNNEHSMMKYDSFGVGVVVESGANFEVQRMKSLKTLIELMGHSESVKEIIDGDGLPILLDNINIRDKNRLVELSRELIEKKKKAAQSQPNPIQMQMQAQQHQMQLQDKALQIKEQDLQLKAMKQQNDFQVDVERLRQSNEKLQDEMMEIKATMMLSIEKANNESDRTQAELMMKQADQQMASEKHQLEVLDKISTPAESPTTGL